MNSLNNNVVKWEFRFSLKKKLFYLFFQNLYFRICKRQKDCYTCASKDAQENGETCIPEETNYGFDAYFDAVTNQPVVECSKFSEKLCE